MDNKKEEVLRTLAKAWSCENVKEDEFVVVDIINALINSGTELCKSHVQKKLKDAVDEGVLRSRLAKNPYSKGSCNAYSPPEGKTWEDVLQYLKTK